MRNNGWRPVPLSLERQDWKWIGGDSWGRQLQMDIGDQLW